jgi:hypothetical protein
MTVCFMPCLKNPQLELRILNLSVILSFSENA